MKSSSGKKLGNQVVLVINNLQRREGIEKALHGDAIPYKLCESWDFEPNTVHVMQGLLTDGFELPHSHLVVVVEGNIYGQQKRKLRNKPKKAKKLIILRIYRSAITLFTACMVSVNMWA